MDKFRNSEFGETSKILSNMKACWSKFNFNMFQLEKYLSY